MRFCLVICLFGALALAAGCSYTLPTPIQSMVDDVAQQTEGVHQVVKQIKSSDLDAAVLDNVKRNYDELVRAHDDWRNQVQRVINNEINHFEADERYKNSVSKLQTASGEFAKAADAALGADASTTVPDWADESRQLIVQSYHERKHKQAAKLVHSQLQLKPWSEI